MKPMAEGSNPIELDRPLDVHRVILEEKCKLAIAVMFVYRMSLVLGCRYFGI
jgi:hypothetical protein